MFNVIFGKVAIVGPLFATVLGTLLGPAFTTSDTGASSGNAGTIANDGGGCNVEELTGFGTDRTLGSTDSLTSDVEAIAEGDSSGTPIAATAVCDSLA